MPRVRRNVASHQRHKKVLELTKGHSGQRHRLYKRAHESMLHALSYSYAHRRERKGDMRQLWILRVNAASRALGLNYAQLIQGLKEANVQVNRKMLADMAVKEPQAFASLVATAKAKLQTS